MWIKICGMTDEPAVAAAMEAGADAIGFVFAPSVRELTVERAAQLAQRARGRVQCVAVTLHPTQSHIEAILDGFRPDVLQIDVVDLADLRLPRTLQLLPVVRTGLSPLPAAVPRRILFEGPRSG